MIMTPEETIQFALQYEPIWHCHLCGDTAENYTPEYCCNGVNCGCRGAPIYQPLCLECQLNEWGVLGARLDSLMTEIHEELRK